MKIHKPTQVWHERITNAVADQIKFTRFQSHMISHRLCKLSLSKKKPKWFSPTPDMTRQSQKEKKILTQTSQLLSNSADDDVCCRPLLNLSRFTDWTRLESDDEKNKSTMWVRCASNECGILAVVFFLLDFTIILSAIARGRTGSFSGWIECGTSLSHTTDKLYLLVFTQHSDFLWAHTFASVMDFSIIITNDRGKNEIRFKVSFADRPHFTYKWKTLKLNVAKSRPVANFLAAFFWSRKKKNFARAIRRMKKIDKKKVKL